MKTELSFAWCLLFTLGSFHLLAEERPHIILVMADDHGYGDTGFTGHPFVQTPHLDAMAEKGVVFNRFYASAPVCSPTRASVMTGRHPFRCNVPNHGHYMRPHEITIAEVLKDAGYVTGHFGKWHIGSVQPNSPTNPGGAGFDEWLSGLNFFDNDPYLSRNGVYEHLNGPGTAVSMDATIHFLKKHVGGTKPIFAVTWFPSPHDPHREIPQAIEGSAQLYDDQETKKAGYFREITLLDQQVGRLRKTLRELQIADNTVLFYCSDNGGLVPESSGGRAKKGSIYEGGLRVPAILQWPARYQPKSIDTPAFASDLFPTMAAIAGVPITRQHPLDGIDLQPVISGKQVTRPPMGFWHGHTNGQGTYSDRIIRDLKEAKEAGKPNPYPQRILKNVEQFPSFGEDGMRGHAAWNAWPWKLHRIQKNGRVKWELYNLSQDPLEKKDLQHDEPARATMMKQRLEAWQRSVLASWSGEDYRETKPWKASRQSIERFSRRGNQFNYDESKIPKYTLPDPLINADGTQVTNSDDWYQSRRAELLELFRSHVYGRRPKTEYQIQFEQTDLIKDAFDGAAKGRSMKATITIADRSFSFPFVVFVPNQQRRPVPAVIHINNRYFIPLEKAESEDDPFWPARRIVERGYATASFHTSHVDPDKRDGYSEGIRSFFANGEPPADEAWRSLSAWGWAASRILDHLESLKEVDGKRVAVVGHSRGGKTSLWAACEDTRFAIAYSNNSGCGGAALSRRAYGETVGRITASFPHWFCRPFADYAGRENELPVDQHEVMALIAPRGVYIASADDDLWADPRGEYQSLVAAATVFRLLGKESIVDGSMPVLNRPRTVGSTGYHIRSGGHGLGLTDWNWFLDFFDRQVNP